MFVMAKPLLLKTFVLDAILKDTKSHPDNLKEGKGGYFVSLEVVDFSDKVPNAELKFRTKVVGSYTAGWKQSCAISVEQDKLSTYKALKGTLFFSPKIFGFFLSLTRRFLVLSFALVFLLPFSFLSPFLIFLVSLWKGIPAKSSKQVVTSCIGNCPDILLTQIPDATKLEQRFNLMHSGELQG